MALRHRCECECRRTYGVSRGYLLEPTVSRGYLLGPTVSRGYLLGPSQALRTNVLTLPATVGTPSRKNNTSSCSCSCTCTAPAHSNTRMTKPQPPSSSHLANPLATPGQLASSGSRLDGVPSDLESSIIFAGARLTQAAGILLRLPQDTIAQAVVVFTRFWMGSEGGSLGQYGAKVRLHPSLLTSHVSSQIEP